MDFGVKPINFRSPLLVIFSKSYLGHQKSSKKIGPVLIFVSKYMCINKTSFENLIAGQPGSVEILPKC